MVKTVPNSAKYRHTRRYTDPPLHQNTELHQKDLRINLKSVHILGPENELFLAADTNLALSLIVRFSVSRGSLMARRVDILYPRPCQITVNVLNTEN